MKFFYLMEITRVIAFFTCLRSNVDPVLQSWGKRMASSTEPPKTFVAFVNNIIREDRPKLLGQTEYIALYAIVRKYALAFLRKCVIFMHARYNVDFDAVEFPSDVDIDDWSFLDELERLSDLLRLPRMENLFMEDASSRFIYAAQRSWILKIRAVDYKERQGRFVLQSASNPPPNQTPSRTVRGMMTASPWANHHLELALDSDDDGSEVIYTRDDMDVAFMLPPSRYSLGHPGIYELVGLPKDYVVLQEAAARAKCPSSGKAVVDPIVCLDCGAVFCSQSNCCLKKLPDHRLVGGFYMHREKYVFATTLQWAS
jgi:E3 ubiquitin-protein ligase UBR1